jgi:biopolymer transport protein ExbB
MWNVSLLQLFEKGGPVMWPLLACSVIGLAIIAERLIFFVRIRLHYDRFMRDVVGRLGRESRESVVALCRQRRSPVAQLAAVYLENAEQMDALRQDILRREGSRQLELVECRLRGLSVIAHIAPLIGLLGTVTGLVVAFQRIEALTGSVQPGDLAGGIWEALLTTVFGLVVAIPCMAAYHAFEHKADAIARRMQFVISELNEFFGKKDALSETPRREPQEDMAVAE